jgi:hypothetical protein
VISSEKLHSSRFARDPIEYAGIVDWNVLLRDDFDGFLRNETTSQGRYIVKLTPLSSFP